MVSVGCMSKTIRPLKYRLPTSRPWVMTAALGMPPVVPEVKTKAMVSAGLTPALYFPVFGRVAPVTPDKVTTNLRGEGSKRFLILQANAMFEAYGPLAGFAQQFIDHRKNQFRMAPWFNGKSLLNFAVHQ